MRKYLVSALAAFAVAGAAAPAMAKEVKISVSHADLDLSDPADVELLNTRIRVAARRACETPFANYSIAAIDARCKSDLIEAAKEEIQRKVEGATPAMMASAG